MANDFLLISDIDDTLLGDDEALERFHKFIASSELCLDIAYASGRFFESIIEDIKTTLLPEPIAIIGGVGSEIYSYPEGKPDQAWVEQNSQNFSAAIVRNVLAQQPDLELQPEEFQSGFKVSYFLHDALPDRLEQICRSLHDAQIQADYVYSSNRDLDILPRGVDKGTAAAFLAKSLGYAKDHVLVAGNSGNDSKLFEHGFRGIIVANAHDELKQYSVGPRAYLSQYERADGVRDGVEHWSEKP